MLEKTQTVMVIDPNTRIMVGNRVPFVSEERGHHLHIDKEVWTDMGLPDTVTLTIEPGDKLNA